MGATRIAALWAVLCSASGLAVAEPQSVPHRPPPGYELVFSDEFDVDGLPDPARWAYDTHRNAIGWYNQERQYYSKGRLENSRIENGVLVIEARAETLSPESVPDYGGQKFTSARLFTQGKASWTYGFFEIRARVPCVVGSWPAIWMLPEDPNVVWPEGGEIDIMEHVGFAPEEINQTIHTRTFNFSKGSQKTSIFKIDGACDEMHRYQLLWTPDHIAMAVDDEPRFLFKKVRKDRARWPFDSPMHILLNVAVGGVWGGQRGIEEEAFPARMEVDYVRVYQRPDPKDKR
jgi:beta-glucanase (GH16 family)